ncbi:hypothetical protein N7G274_005365 [Stereocaulon virgatum]|uniref:Uncharacterized protein n=1 Tax=Stereocaulon virgatum TaxID=373712 RepID=A0ABR4A8F5_9LECA
MPKSSYSAFDNDATLYDFNDQDHHAVDATGMHQWVPDLGFDMPDTSSGSSKGPTSDVSRANKPRALCHVRNTSFSRKADVERHTKSINPDLQTPIVAKCMVACITATGRIS